MVDYNIAIPQQQLFQAPDIMQNFMRMQQMDQMGATARLRNAQAEQLRGAQQQTAAERAAAAEIDRTVNEGFASGLTPTELANKFAKAGNPAAAAKVVGYGTTLNAGRENDLKLIGAALSGYTFHGSRVQSGDEAYEYGAALQRDPILGPHMAKFGIKSPEQAGEKARADFLRDPDLYRKNNSELSADKLFDMTKPADVDIAGGGKGYRDPNRPGIIKEYGIEEFGAQPGAGAGRVDTYPVNPTRVAGMNAVAKSTGNAPIVQDRGQGTRVAMGGPAPGEPVNALAAGQRQQPAVVGNAMAAPVAAASPYGALVQPPAARAPAVVGSGEFARRVELQKAAEKIAAAENEAYARTQGTSRATAEATAKEKLPELTNTIKELEDAMKPGGLIEQSTASPVGRARDAAGRLINVSTTGSEAIAKLQPLRARLLMSMPRLEGPQGVLDLELYNQASGDMANPEKSTGDRMAAAETVLRIIKANRSQFEARLPEGQRALAGVKRPSNKTEYDALPAGSVYIDPNGDERTKR